MAEIRVYPSEMGTPVDFGSAQVSLPQSVVETMGVQARILSARVAGENISPRAACTLSVLAGSRLATLPYCCGPSANKRPLRRHARMARGMAESSLWTTARSESHRKMTTVGSALAIVETPGETSMVDAVRYQREEELAVVTFTNPERLNPMGTALQQGLRDALARVRKDRGVRALVITGEGRGFCVGADLSDLAEQSGSSVGERTANQMHALSNRLIQELHELPVPVVSAVNGACAGAGVGIALVADIVLVARSAYFYLPFMPRLGIVPDLGTAWFLARSAGRQRAVALTLLGERLQAEEAVRWGIAWACIDDTALASESLHLARRLAALPSHAAVETRRVFDASDRHDLPSQLAYEAERQRDLLDLPTFAEGVRAFLDKRSPRFEGR